MKPKRLQTLHFFIYNLFNKKVGATIISKLSKRCFTQTEYDSFYSQVCSDYAEELEISGKLDHVNAVNKAESENKRLLSQGLSTPGAHFALFEENCHTIGYYWLTEKQKGMILLGFIFIYPEFRGLGYGKRLMSMVEKDATKLGKKYVILNVFKYNQAAVGLYKKCGYKVKLENEYAYGMRKKLL
ncbi:MAG: GNAT family N-acetyltransferase [Eubacteriales bacterium]